MPHLNLSPEVKLTIKPAEAAKALGVSLPTLYQLLKRTDSPAIHIGRKIVIPTDKFQEWISGLAGQYVDLERQ